MTVYLFLFLVVDEDADGGFCAVQVLVNVISGGLTPSFTIKEAEEMGAKIISESWCFSIPIPTPIPPPPVLAPHISFLNLHLLFPVFSLVSAVAAVHGIRAAMHSLKKTGTDLTSAQGMDPRAFFEIMWVPF